MKKKNIIIAIIVVLLLCCLIPIPTRLKDGGTVQYRAVLYTYVRWKIMADEQRDPMRDTPEYKKYYKDGYLQRTKLYLFPHNYENISIWDE